MGLTVKKNEDGTFTIVCEGQEVRVSFDGQESNQDDDQRGAPRPIKLGPAAGGGAFLQTKKRPHILISVVVESVDDIKKFAENLRRGNFLRLRDSNTVFVRFRWANRDELAPGGVLKEFEDDIRPEPNDNLLFHYEILMSHDE